MPLLKILATGSGNIGIWKISEPVSVLRDFAGESLCSGLCDVKSQKRSAERYAVRALLSEMWQKLGMAGLPRRIIYNAEGRPSLEDGTPVSISHTDGYAVLYIGTDNQVGVDIEIRSDRALGLAGYFMGEQELALQKHNADTAVISWSARESVYKIAGRAAADFKDSLRILPFVPEAAGTLSLLCGNGTDSTTFSVIYQIWPEFILTYTELPSSR